MSFANRFLLWLLLPPALVGLPLSILFITEVVHLNSYGWMRLVGLGAVSGLAALIMVAGIRPKAVCVEQSRADQDVSEILSDAHRTTVVASLRAWLLGGLVFSCLASWLILPSSFGFVVFLDAALIAAAPSIIWTYAISKRLLVAEGRQKARFRYIGSELPLGTKIAVAFIGLFVVTTATVVILVSAQVSTTLEKTVIGGESAQFDLAFQKVSALATIDVAALEQIRLEVTPEHSLHVIRGAGDVIASVAPGSEPLSEVDVQLILETKEGDSSAFVSPTVGKFKPLPNGATLFVEIPFDNFASIPAQIAKFTVIVSIITTLIFIAVTLFLSRDLGGPLRELRRSAARMAEGDFGSEARIFADDEVGSLATSFDDTRLNLRTLLAKMGDRGNAITEGVKVMGSGTDTLVTGAREQTELTRNASAAVGNVRKGAETVFSATDKVGEFAGESSTRATELRASAEAVVRNMEELFSSVDKSSSSVSQMNATAGSTSGRTDVLSNIGEEVLSFVSEMDATIDELRKTAQSTAEISRRVREDAAAGSEAVGKTVSGIQETSETTMQTAQVMNELQRSIGKISQILIVIEEVTNKTNLLSLNAAIIAAQAGEQGSSFTVVADEIRELAERTRGSTKEIGGIVKAIQQGSKEVVGSMHEVVENVKKNVKVAQEAADSLSKIQQSSGRTWEMANQISNALDEQGAASRHLHEVTSRMADHIGEIHRATKEQASATQLLAEESERVRDIALQVKRSADEQSLSARGIGEAMENIAGDIGAIRKMLEAQRAETEKIAKATSTMLDIAQANDSIAQEFNRALGDLVETGREFDNELKRFRG
ncbi:MAG: methyl-accepting chemotaxis protein [Thermoanaerobaculia bacterium]|nr:methyl-accepting chemotaxis protein [Thermoanaerobaculia bacterium]